MSRIGTISMGNPTVARTSVSEIQPPGTAAIPTPAIKHDAAARSCCQNVI